MAKAKKGARAGAVSRTVGTKRKWPRTADLRPWLESYLDLCEGHSKPGQGGLRACVPLRQLAECGRETAALARLQRLLDRLPPTECEATSFLALAGAEISLDLPDLRRAETFLELAESRLKKAAPRVRKALEIRLPRLRAMNGLPDSPAASAVGSNTELRPLGEDRQAARAALLAGDRVAAARALQRVLKRIPDFDPFYLKPGLVLSVIQGLRRVGDEAALGKSLAWLDRNGQASYLVTGSLRGMGFVDLANEHAEDRVARLRKRLKQDADPNIHFPVHEICDELWFFVQTGQPETAARLLQQVLREMPRWPGLRGGFAASGVLTELAELVAELDSPEAACGLLGLAVEAGRAEPDRGFRKGALQAAKAQLDAPGLAAAIARAESIKSAPKRREALIPLLTRRAAWTELAAVLEEITDPGELFEAVHGVLFRLPGGSRLA